MHYSIKKRCSMNNDTIFRLSKQIIDRGMRFYKELSFLKRTEQSMTKRITDLMSP